MNPHSERGAILLIVLMLSVVCSLLALSLAATVEIAGRASANADALDRAERAALSAVEWGVAAVKAEGLLAFSRSARVDDLELSAEVRLLGSPRVIGTGRCQGAVARFGADVRFAESPRAYALACYAGDNKLDGNLVVTGNAYVAGSGQALTGSGRLTIDGNLDLATSTSVSAGKVTHLSGATTYNRPSKAAPVWNTLPFDLNLGWTVPVHRYSGNTTLKDTTLNGIVYVSIGIGQELRLENLTINGTLVVPSLYPPLTDLLGKARIQVKKNVVVNGGTADTGNLAILAPAARLENNGIERFEVTGVSYVMEMDSLEKSTFTGMLIVRNNFTAMKNSVSVVRPSTFFPELPAGPQLDYSNDMIVSWKGRY